MTTAPNSPVHPDWDSYVADAEDGPMFVSFDWPRPRRSLSGTLKTCLRVPDPD